MRNSEFWESMRTVFGPTYARSLASDLVIGALGGLTAQEALDAGTAPRDVWHALCDAMEVTADQRWVYRDVKPRSSAAARRGD